MKDKYILSLPKKGKMFVKVLLLFLITFLFLLTCALGLGFIGMVLSRIFSYKEFQISLIIGVFELFIMTASILYLCLKLPLKIVIENGKIIKIISKNKQKELGNLSDITSFSCGYSYVYIIKNDDKLFKFPYYGIDNNEFINYLSNNYKKNIYIEGNVLFMSIFYWIAMVMIILCIPETSIFSIIGIFITTFLLYLFIRESKFKFKMTNNEVIYRLIFKEEKIKVSDLTQVVETVEKGYGRYKLIQPNYTINLYRNGKRIISASYITKEGIKEINQILKDNKVKVIKKNFK